LLLLVYIIAYC